MAIKIVSNVFTDSVVFAGKSINFSFRGDTLSRSIILNDAKNNKNYVCQFPFLGQSANYQQIRAKAISTGDKIIDLGGSFSTLFPKCPIPSSINLSISLGTFGSISQVTRNLQLKPSGNFLVAAQNLASFSTQSSSFPYPCVTCRFTVLGSVKYTDLGILNVVSGSLTPLTSSDMAVYEELGFEYEPIVSLNDMLNKNFLVNSI